MSEEVVVRAATLAEALDQVRRRLGADAVVVATRKRREGFMGLWGSRSVEVRARPAGPEAARIAAPAAFAPRSATAEERRGGKESHRDGAGGNDESVPSGDGRSQIQELKRLAVGLLRRRKDHLLRDLHPVYFAWFRGLVDLGLEEDRAQDLVLLMRQEVGQTPPPEDRMRSQVLARLVELARIDDGSADAPAAEGAGQLRVVLLGPSGAGKTTVLAKLASRWALERRRKVGLISLDTNRIGATEQIEAYARLLDVPMRVAESNEKLARVLDEFSGREVVLVDTLGLNHTERDRIAQLAQRLNVLGRPRTHVVVPPSLEPRTAAEIVRAFQPLGPRWLVVSKIDETVTPAACVALSRQFDGGISYVSFGQTVPEDLAPATSALLARLFARHPPFTSADGPSG